MEIINVKYMIEKINKEVDKYLESYLFETNNQTWSKIENTLKELVLFKQIDDFTIDESNKNINIFIKPVRTLDYIKYDFKIVKPKKVFKLPEYLFEI